MPQRIRFALLHRLRAALPVRPRPAPASAPPPRRRRRWPRALAALLALLLLVFVSVSGYAYWLVGASLPQLAGTVTAPGLSAPVRVERDHLGIPTLHAGNRLDLAFATGFVHGQDRFFQMDLARRHPAGELAELFGPVAVGEDRRLRVHRFRDRARRRLEQSSSQERDMVDLLNAYAAGVEAGRRSLRRPPWEYALLRAEPRPWTPEDSLLVVYEMYLALQSDGIRHERDQGLMHDLLPPALVKFLTPAGSPWDAPMLGGPLPGPAIPDADAIDLRKEPARWLASSAPAADESDFRAGSNNWAVAGSRTAHGGAIVANDMHLGLRVPTTWYRAAFRYRDTDGEHHVIGVTLPGAPALVAGSNTHIAWGFTNTEGDYADLVVLEPDGPGQYRTPSGPKPFVRHEETIRVRGGPDVTMLVEETIWGPVYDKDHKGRSRALRWVAHDPEGINLELLRLEKARTLDDALAIAPRCGTPAQNFVVADRRGDIGWTVLGKIPKRVGHDGTRPASWADGSCRWDGWLAPEDYPRLVRPEEGILWTANNRVVGDPWRSRLGLGNYDHGARAMQIRDDLRSVGGGTPPNPRARPKLSETDMLAIQLDDRALFLERWQRLLLDTLTPAAAEADARRAAIRREVVAWGARAGVESVGFRVVKRWRARVMQAVLRSLTAPCHRFGGGAPEANVEESVWQLVTRRPPHLLPPGNASWEVLLLNEVDRLAAEIQAKHLTFDAALAAYTWGAANRAGIRHPLSGAVGPLNYLLNLDMPDEPLPGDSRGMPRIQAPGMGASQRMAVSPGREAEGYYQLPGGQSGHPWSPHYRDGYAAWARGRATPFLPGPAVNVLELRP